MSAMIRNRSMPTSIPNRINAEYYQQRAAGGAGLIVTENILIVPNCATRLRIYLVFFNASSHIKS